MNSQAKKTVLPVLTESDIKYYFKRNKILMTAKNANAEIGKSNKLNTFRTAYLAMLPGKMSGYQMCPNSEHCFDDCIAHSSGRNADPKNIIAKYYRTQFFMRYRDDFKEQLYKETDNFSKLCQSQDKTASIRNNAYSDVVWEKVFPELFEIPHTVFYDYTKLFRRVNNFIPSNYFLTYSLVAADHQDLSEFSGLRRQFSAVVDRSIYDSIDWQWSEMWQERFKMVWVNGRSIRLIDGDDTDLTFTKSNGILILKEKYLSKPENDNPLVYRDKRAFGL